MFEYNQNEIDKIIQRIDDYSFKTSIGASSIDVTNWRRERNGTVRIKPLDEKIASFYLGLKFPSHHYLFPSINAKIPTLSESGFVAHWNQCSSIFCKMIPIVFEPNVLTMNHLEKGFVIWIALLAVACLVFLLELLIYWTPKYLTRVWFEFVITSYYGMLNVAH